MESPQVMISKPEDSALGEILSLLDTVDLPPDGVAEYLDGFLVARDDTGRLVGCAGMDRRRVPLLHDRYDLCLIRPPFRRDRTSDPKE
jgi:hypothetical protein